MRDRLVANRLVGVGQRTELVRQTLAGLILDSLARSRVEQLRLRYLSMPNAFGFPRPSFALAGASATGTANTQKAA